MVKFSKGNGIETKANESFDNGIFINIEANIILETKPTSLTVRNIFLSEVTLFLLFFGKIFQQMNLE